MTNASQYCPACHVTYEDTPRFCARCGYEFRRHQGLTANQVSGMLIGLAILAAPIISVGMKSKHESWASASAAAATAPNISGHQMGETFDTFLKECHIDYASACRAENRRPFSDECNLERANGTESPACSQGKRGTMVVDYKRECEAIDEIRDKGRGIFQDFLVVADGDHLSEAEFNRAYQDPPKEKQILWTFRDGKLSGAVMPAASDGATAVKAEIARLTAAYGQPKTEKHYNCSMSLKDEAWKKGGDCEQYRLSWHTPDDIWITTTETHATFGGKEKPLYLLDYVRLRAKSHGGGD
jgi:hypothetical protein